MYMRKNFIIATAGHVDHGKTSLIQALTGKDCDTHPEEKKRGITIHLGFSHIKLSDELYAGIIDVPGHKDFIDNMISGINGIDMVLFVVSADEGFMPQSLEHLQILNMYGVKKGVIVITKCDLVSSENFEIVKEEIRENFIGSFLENAPVIGISVRSGINIELLKKSLFTVLSEQYNTKTLSISNHFRLYPDRFFQIKGFGSVVTGTVLSGQLVKSNILYSVPSNKEYKIRKLEAYGNDTDVIIQGQRASINISNLSKEDFERGMMLCTEPYTLTTLIDVELSLFNNADIKFLNQWATVEFYVATIQCQCKIHIIDEDKLLPGEMCFAQIHLNRAIAVCYGDKFIIRNSSGINTLGGGRILDAFPLHHKKRTEKVKKLLQLRATEGIKHLILAEVEKSVKALSIDQIYKKLYLNNIEPISEFDYESVFMGNDGGITWFWNKNIHEKLGDKIVKYLQIAHKQNPLSNLGKNIDEFTLIAKDFPDGSKIIVIKSILDTLIKRELIENRKKTYALKSHHVHLEQEDHIKINWVDQYILNQRLTVPLWSELLEKANKKNIHEKKLKQMLVYLISIKRIIHFDGEYVHSIVVNQARQKLLEYLLQHSAGITGAEFRDLLNGNRKMALLLLNIFDSENIIIRIEDKRYITEKGKNFYQIL